MLAGFHAMDEHFRTAPLSENLPVLMGLLAVWYGNFFGAQTIGVMPYEQYLKRFPAYLQQLTMESNGKHVTLDGVPVDYETGPVYWGEPGTNGQHSFYQLIHQGTRADPGRPDRLRQDPQPAPRPPRHPVVERVRAGAGARVRQDRGGGPGRGHPRAVVPHRVMAGNRPTNVLLAEKLTPRILGALVALYEHSVFTQGTIWGIDSFDQWGVELGKAAGRRDHPRARERRPSPSSAHDSSTNTLIRRYRGDSRRPSRERTWQLTAHAARHGRAGPDGANLVRRLMRDGHAASSTT